MAGEPKTTHVVADMTPRDYPTGERLVSMNDGSCWRVYCGSPPPRGTGDRRGVVYADGTFKETP